MRRHRFLAVVLVLVALLALPARAVLSGEAGGGLVHHTPAALTAVMEQAPGGGRHHDGGPADHHDHGDLGNHGEYAPAEGEGAICPVHGAVPVPAADTDDAPAMAGSCCSFACTVLALPVPPQALPLQAPRGFGPTIIPAAGPGRVTAPPLRPPKA